MENLETRVKQFSKELRAGGVRVRRNVMACCRSCADLGEHTYPATIWSFGGQGCSVSISGDDAYHQTGKYDYQEAGIVFFNHDGLVENDGTLSKYGELVISALTRYGIAWEWNLTDARCIEVDFSKSTTSYHNEHKEDTLVSSMMFV
jgi:hypothetical protein